mgnify:CR=1 FL=1
MAKDKIVVEAEVKSNIGEVSKDAGALASEFKVMGVSLNSVKAGFVAVGRAAKASFATIKAGIASTGIGLFVLAIGSLASYFTNTKRGADKLQVALTAIGTVTSVLMDRFSSLGEGIGLIFSGKWREGAKLLADSFKGIGAEVSEEVKIMTALEKRVQSLRDAENEFMVQKAKTRQEIERARLIAEDETKSAKERLDNLKVALDLEEKTTQRELELAREKVAIQAEQMKQSENLVEDEALLAQFKTDLIEKETASIKMRRRVVTEVNALDREIAAEQKARADETMSALDAEIAANKKRTGELTKMPRIANDVADELILADDKVMENYIANTKIRTLKTQEQIDAELSAYATLAGALSSLAGDNKELAIAETIISTYSGATKALAAGAGTPVGWINAAAIIAAGLANVQRIVSTPIEGSSGGGGGGGGGLNPPTQTPAPQMMSGAFELGGGVAPEPVRAYVVTDEMTNSQNQLANIRRRATI